MSRGCAALPLSDGTVARVHADLPLTPEVRAGLIELLDATVRAYSERPTVQEATTILAHPDRYTEFEIRCARDVVAEHNRRVDAVCDAMGGAL